jgi:hypothetical protein
VKFVDWPTGETGRLTTDRENDEGRSGNDHSSVLLGRAQHAWRAQKKTIGYIYCCPVPHSGRYRPVSSISAAGTYFAVLEIG